MWGFPRYQVTSSLKGPRHRPNSNQRTNAFIRPLRCLSSYQLGRKVALKHNYTAAGTLCACTRWSQTSVGASLVAPVRPAHNQSEAPILRRLRSQASQVELDQTIVRAVRQSFQHSWNTEQICYRTRPSLPRRFRWPTVRSACSTLTWSSGLPRQGRKSSKALRP